MIPDGRVPPIVAEHAAYPRERHRHHSTSVENGPLRARGAEQDGLPRRVVEGSLRASHRQASRRETQPVSRCRTRRTCCECPHSGTDLRGGGRRGRHRGETGCQVQGTQLNCMQEAGPVTLQAQPAEPSTLSTPAPPCLCPDRALLNQDHLRLHETCYGGRRASAHSRGPRSSFPSGAGRVGWRVSHRQQAPRCLRLQACAGAGERASQGRSWTPDHGEEDPARALTASCGVGRGFKAKQARRRISQTMRKNIQPGMPCCATPRVV